MSQPPREDRVVRGPRVVRDHKGDLVSIVERRTDGVAGARGPSCLIFSTELGFTRVWGYPVNWTDLPEEQLLALVDRPRRSQSA